MPKARHVLSTSDLSPVIARFRQIAAEAGDHLLLGDGPPHPDAKLLDLCAEIAAAHKAVGAIRREMNAKPSPWPGQPGYAQYEADRAAEKTAERRYAQLLTAAGKLAATTGAGVYAKALAIRASKTGAATLAMSLAADLIDNPTLRAMLWARDEAEAEV